MDDASALLSRVEFGQPYEVQSSEEYGDGTVGMVLTFNAPLDGAAIRLPAGFDRSKTVEPGVAWEDDPVGRFVTGPNPRDSARDCNLSLLEVEHGHADLKRYNTVVEVQVNCPA